MADENEVYYHPNPKTGVVEQRVDKATTFPYLNPQTGVMEQRSVYPTMFERVVENFKDTGAIDKQRERYLKTLELLGKPAPNKTNWHSE